MKEFTITFTKQQNSCSWTGKHKHTVINVTDIVGHWSSLGLLLKGITFEKFLKETEADLHVTLENRKPKMLHNSSPNSPSRHDWEGWMLPLQTQREGSASLPTPRTSCWMWAWKEPGCFSGSGPLFLLPHTYAHRGGKNLGPLPLTLRR